MLYTMKYIMNTQLDIKIVFTQKHVIYVFGLEVYRVQHLPIMQSYIQFMCKIKSLVLKYRVLLCGYLYGCILFEGVHTYISFN